MSLAGTPTPANGHASTIGEISRTCLIKGNFVSVTCSRPFSHPSALSLRRRGAYRPSVTSARPSSSTITFGQLQWRFEYSCTSPVHFSSFPPLWAFHIPVGPLRSSRISAVGIPVAHDRTHGPASSTWTSLSLLEMPVRRGTRALLPSVTNAIDDLTRRSRYRHAASSRRSPRQSLTIDLIATSPRLQVPLGSTGRSEKYNITWHRPVFPFPVVARRMLPSSSGGREKCGGVVLSNTTSSVVTSRCPKLSVLRCSADRSPANNMIIPSSAVWQLLEVLELS